MTPVTFEDLGLPEDPFDYGEMLPHPEWSVVYDVLEAMEEDAKGAERWNAFGREWLERMRAELGDGYEIHDAPGVLLLGRRTPPETRDLLRIVRRAQEYAQEGLGEDAWRGGAGNLVVIAFHHPDRYYDYRGFRDGEGEFGLSAGCYLARPLDVILLEATGPFGAIEHTLAHEVCHAWLSPRRLPLWLEEGLVQVMTDWLMSRSSLTCSLEQIEEHHTFWSEVGLLEFWSGRGFSRPDEGQRLSYMLAHVLVLGMLKQGREEFFRYVKETYGSVSGVAASRRVYGIELKDWVVPFLGEGDWES